MLARQNRINQKRDFTKIKKTGKLIHSESFGISYIDRADGAPSRFGFIISTKVSKAATIRNKAKRALSEGVRYIIVYIKDGYDFVFLANPIIVKKYTTELMQEVKETFSKAGLLK